MNEISGTQRYRPRTRQNGAVAIEFVFVFPILFAVAYAAVVYSYVYLLQQSVNFAAQQGAQAAVAVAPLSSAADTVAKRLSDATAAAQSSLSWLPADQLPRISVTSPADCGASVAPIVGSSIVIRVNFDLNAGGALFPSVVGLPYLGDIPPLPAALNACAVAFT
jgi:hypothetical protein